MTLAAGAQRYLHAVPSRTSRASSRDIHLEPVPTGTMCSGPAGGDEGN
jgi:hypothetical protein